MQVFVARQPIFDKIKRVVAYELLFRSGFENFFSADDGDTATQTVIGGVVNIFGLTSLTGGKPVFIIHKAIARQQVSPRPSTIALGH